MEFTIRAAKEGDMPQVLNLIQELAIYEKEGDSVEITADDLIKDGFGENKRFHCFVGETDGKVVGMAMVYTRYSTWKGTTLHLEDFVVTEPMRGSGLGSALMAETVKYGRDMGAKRISWEVLDWNEPAIRFYEGIGADVMRHWHVVQLDEESIAKFLKNKG
ncbi:GNAT family N-acetyltransferase [Pricia sp. S334]|uniref:GNAT family N-acetyltransferase n=1 Tax=Pricia mediterranea TaxID=3076079 RepID=A0ABU3L5X4_9FLAO|nr:GNAT family N-acetyltransferase [Pricia sp. S334]MDT7828507.1 GNAT family N-acetyltransferase [Pricia sp. S334]